MKPIKQNMQIYVLIFLPVRAEFVKKERERT